jgi:FAD/FMN-containing dehydrogenase
MRQNRTTWQNWSNTIQFEPSFFFQPTTIAELSAILRQAVQAGKAVRAVGSGHSWSLGAVPGAAAYVPNAEIDGYLIDLTQLNPTNAAADPSLKAFYFKDSAGTQYVAVPPGTPQGWFADNLADVNDPLHEYSNEHDPAAIGSMGPAPDINLGGFVANGCHGTGWDQATVSDLVVAIEMLTVDAAGAVVMRTIATSSEIAKLLTNNKVTFAPITVSPDMLLGARVALGAFGIVTKLVFVLEPLFNVAVLDEIADVDLLFPPNGDPSNLEQLVTSTDYVEIFWFPYNRQLWVKRFSRSDMAPQHEAKVLGLHFIVSELAALTHGLLGEFFKLFPLATPPLLQILFENVKLFMGERHLRALSFNDDWDASTDPVVPVQHAYSYQSKYFTNFLDLEHTVPIVAKTGGGYDFTKVIAAWQEAVNAIGALEAQGQFPVTINIHLRFVNNSNALLSPAWQANDTTHTCYIEFISFSEQLREYTEYAERVIPKWESYGGLPNWGKILQVYPQAYADSYAKLRNRGTLAPFLTLRQQMDPRNIFMNDFLNQLLLGSPSGAPASPNHYFDCRVLSIGFVKELVAAIVSKVIGAITPTGSTHIGPSRRFPAAPHYVGTMTAAAPARSRRGSRLV